MQIDFYLHDANDIVAWESVLVALRRREVDARFVLEPPGVHTGTVRVPHSGDPDAREIRVPAMTAGVYEDVIDALSARGHSALMRGRYRSADAVVSNREMRRLLRYRGLRIRMSHGSPPLRRGRDRGEVNQGFDGVLVHGEHGRQCAARWVSGDDVVVVGYPKMAAWYRGAFDLERLRTSFGLNRKRKTIVYLSTWAHRSTLEQFSAAIEALGRTYNVVYKPHPGNLRFEPERFELLRRSPYVVVDTRERCVVPFLAAADLVVTDVLSGALTEACLVDRPTIGLARDPSVLADLVAGVDEAVPVVSDPAELAPLAEYMLHNDGYAEWRWRLAAQMFADVGGKDDEVCARAIIALVERKRAPAAVADRRHYAEALV